MDLAPIDESDPAENAKVIVNELQQYSENLAEKPRWLVFNKIDLIDPEEAEKRAKAIVETLGWEGKYYMISAANRDNVNALCWDVMSFLNSQPKAMAIAESVPEKVEFMWDDYHREQLAEVEAEAEDDWDDDWDEEDDDGVEIIYER